jgi:arginine decarboxylase
MFDYRKVPDVYCFCAGKSTNKTELTSFDGALLNAGVGNTNLIKVSSILPPHCEQIELFALPQGMLLPIAYASITSDHSGKTISSAIAVAIPLNRSLAGVIMEHSEIAELDVVEAHVKDMVEESMAVRGIKNYIVQSKGIEALVVEPFTTAFAGVVLCWEL